MNHDLLHYYERELAWFKQASTDFAAAYPTVAGNIGMRENIVEDPHVSRLIESVALLNARIQQQLDADFPQISDAMLEHLHPQYLAPIPAMTIVEMVAADDEQPRTIEAHSIICSSPVNGVSCQFRTIYPVTLLPMTLASAQLLPQPLHTPGADTARKSAATLALHFKANNDDFSLSAHGIDKVRFFLRGAQYTWPLYRLLTDHCVQITIAGTAVNSIPVTISSENLRIVGFGADEALLPGLRPTPQPDHFLTELMHFPQKFLFIDLQGLAAATAQIRGDFSVFFYLDAGDRELERNIDAGFFSLTATPAVNLFPHIAEPIPLSATCIEYPLIPDARHSDSYEVYAIAQAVQIDEISGQHCRIEPFFNATYHSGSNQLFHSHRRELVKRGDAMDTGFDSFITFSDIAGAAPATHRAIVKLDLLCSNRNLPSRLPPGPLQFRLRVDNGRVKKIHALLPMTMAERRPAGNAARWRLLSILNGSLSGLCGAEDGGAALREILFLHAAEDTAATRALISAIDDVQLNRIMLPLRSHGRMALCCGIDVCITFSDDRQPGSSLTLYATALEHFLAQSVNINSFVRISIRCRGRADIMKQRPPRAGTRTLL